MTETTERIKRCTKCKRMLAISEFYVNEVKPTGTVVFNGRCKRCTVRAVAKRRAERNGKVYETREEHYRSKGIARASRLAELADQKSQDKLARLVALEHREKKWEMRGLDKTVMRQRARLLKIFNAMQDESARWKSKMGSVRRTMRTRAPHQEQQEKENIRGTWGKSATMARRQLRDKCMRSARIKSNPWVLVMETKARNFRRKNGGR